jgi:predicted metal-binding protein
LLKNIAPEETMPICRVCGEAKAEGEFRNITNFTKYKKHTVCWCRDCQKLWLDMKREKERMKKFLTLPQNFEVSFQ